MRIEIHSFLLVPSGVFIGGRGGVWVMDPMTLLDFFFEKLLQSLQICNDFQVANDPQIVLKGVKAITFSTFYAKNREILNKNNW